MTNSYDNAYDEIPECCCDGMKENEKLKRENAELRAMVNELRTSLIKSIGWLEDINPVLCDVLQEVLDKTTQQPIHDHDMRIAEKVREACLEILYSTRTLSSDGTTVKAIHRINFEELLNEKTN